MEATKRMAIGTTRPPFAPEPLGDNKENDNGKKKFSIGNRFVLKSLIPVGTFYKTYKGIDLQSRKFVTIYIKPVKN